jgi:hypothetical protein
MHATEAIVERRYEKFPDAAKLAEQIFPWSKGMSRAYVAAFADQARKIIGYLGFPDPGRASKDDIYTTEEFLCKK